MTRTATECPGSDIKKATTFCVNTEKFSKLEVDKFEGAGVHQCSCVFSLNGNVPITSKEPLVSLQL
jgi:hypothetical protein